MTIGFVGFGLFGCLFSTFDFVLYYLIGCCVNSVG